MQHCSAFDDAASPACSIQASSTTDRDICRTFSSHRILGSVDTDRLSNQSCPGRQGREPRAQRDHHRRRLNIPSSRNSDACRMDSDQKRIFHRKCRQRRNDCTCDDPMRTRLQCLCPRERVGREQDPLGPQLCQDGRVQKPFPELRELAHSDSWPIQTASA